MTVKTFISRPLLSIVISVFIVLLGVISLLSLPVERYPDIAPPAIYVWASYPGASAETVHKSVVMPLEEAINGVEGMTYMTSSASNGSASITIYFEQGANADMAAVNVQNRVIQAQAQLPAEVLQTGVATEKRQPGQLRIIALVLVIGTVVDDSIVVVEAVKAKLDEGFTTTRKASEDAMNGLSVTLFTTTLVFMVIFIPVAFVGGITGIFFKQFGLTMAVAVGISLINALTLSPALCALMLKPSSVETCHDASLHKPGISSLHSRIRTAYDITFNTLLKHYTKMVRWLLGHKCLTVGSVAEGSSSGRAIKAIRETAAKELPVGYSIEFGGITREENQTSSRVIFIFLICIVFAYLVMVALYESLFIPLAVMLSVPFGLAGSLLFAKLFGVENNIYMQIGMVMLVGLLSKTAILLTEYASQARREGMSLADAALSSAKVRLRPILMTSLTMIIGMLPLMFASGVGANGSRTIGVCVVGGMLFGTLGLLLTVPMLFVVFQKVQERVNKNKSDQ